MNIAEIQGNTGTSTVMVGESISNLAQYVPLERTVVITDENVRHAYGHLLPDCPVLTIGTGETAKTLDTVGRLYESLMTLSADRSAFVVAVGGGIVCDVTGFVASTYLRGVRFGFVASTLLAQVDASVGGKNGVNVGGYKNMAGVFNQPEFVICDLDLLGTLPERDILCGFAEIIKHAAIIDRNLFAFLEDNGHRARELDRDVMAKLVFDSVRIKAAVVGRDEREAGERRKLNFGHTFGHAVEKVNGIPHGEAVALGMVVAAALSCRKGWLSREEVNRLEALIDSMGLPTRLDCDPKALFDAMKKDKKREGDAIHFVLLDGLGKAVVEKIDLAELEAAVHSLD
jgi:3-dehydroquinate synthase